MKEKTLSRSLVDPFQEARKKHDSGKLISSSPASPKAPLSLNPTMPNEVEAYNASKLPDLLKKFGLDSSGLAMNDLGRMQLIGRLKKRFGDEFNTHSEALDILSAFNEQLNSAEDKGKKSYNSAISGADRTLKAILGG